MSFNITNFDRSDLINVAKDTLFENDLASSFGISTTSNNVKQFYNRFGQNSVFQQNKLVYKINTAAFFDVSFFFHPGTADGVESKVAQLLRNSLSQSAEEELKYFIQSVEIPAFTVHEAGESYPSDLGMGIKSGIIVKPSTNEFSISFLNTEYSLHEHVFYYWMKETTSNRWEYATRPFTKADLRVSMLDSSTNEVLYTYIIAGARPIEISNPTFSQQTPELTRSVKFAFTNLYLTSQEKMTSDVLNDVFNSFIGSKIKDKVRHKTGTIARKTNETTGVITMRK